jgi:hypothetical protein
LRNVEVARGKKRVLDMAVLQAHKEDQFCVEIKYYGNESPLLLNLVPVQNRSENKWGMWKYVDNKFGKKF